MEIFSKYLAFFISLIICLFPNGTESGSSEILSEFQNITSKALSIDDLLFTDGLFPDHVIPQHTPHHEAIRFFNDLLDDPDTLTEAYQKYRFQHGKETEDDVKFDARKMHFRERLHMIFQQNLQHDAGHTGFQLGVNHFADMTKDEMMYFLGAEVPIGHSNFSESHGPFPQDSTNHGPPSMSATVYPKSFDLRELGVVTAIKNQLKCGSCVHFSHGALLETLYALVNDVHIDVSEQMMLDCALPKHGYENNAGCRGNIMEDTGRFLMDHGVTTEKEYQYMAKEGECAKSGKTIVAKLKDHYQVPPSVEGFKHVLYTLRQPIAAAFLVHPTFMFYRTGVFDQCAPPMGYIGGHAVLIVGFGQFFDTQYFIVKNSWGRSWGENGYFKYIAGSKFCQFERWGFTGTLV